MKDQGWTGSAAPVFIFWRSSFWYFVLSGLIINDYGLQNKTTISYCFSFSGTLMKYVTTCLLWKQADSCNCIWGHEKWSWRLSDSVLAYITCDQYPRLGQFQWHHKTRPRTDYWKIWISVSGHMSTISLLIEKSGPPHRLPLLQDHGFKRGHLHCVTIAPMAAQATQIQWAQLQCGPWAPTSTHVAINRSHWHLCKPWLKKGLRLRHGPWVLW